MNSICALLIGNSMKPLDILTWTFVNSCLWLWYPLTVLPLPPWCRYFTEYALWTSEVLEECVLV